MNNHKTILYILALQQNKHLSIYNKKQCLYKGTDPCVFLTQAMVATLQKYKF